MTHRLLWSASLLALLLLQQLGLVHHYAHAQRWDVAGAAVITTTADRVSAAGPSLESAGGLLAHDSGLCVLLDHLAVGDGHSPSAPLLLAAALLTFSFLSVLAGKFIARWAAPFQARGPPAAH